MNGTNLFDLIEIFPDNAPKSITELPEFAEKCKEAGFMDAYEYLIEWMFKMNEYLQTEWFIGVEHDNSTDY